MTTAASPVDAEEPHPRPVVLFVHGSAEMYGADKVLLNLARGIVAEGRYLPVVALHEEGPLRAALESSGVEVHVIDVMKITRTTYTPTGVVMLPWQARSTVRALDRIVGGRRVGLVHSNTVAVLGGAVWARVRRRPHLWHVHEIILKPALARRLLPRMVDWLTQHVVCISAATEAWLLSEAPRLEGRATIVFNGLGELPPPDGAAITRFRHAVRAADDDVVVTVAGRLNHWKGQGLLLSAVERLRTDGRLGRGRVAVVGDVYAGHADFKAQLRQQAEAANLGDLVSFVPFTDDIYSVWRGSQIAVIPSLEPEPFGMVAIEAMACGLPTVAAAHGGLVDVVIPEVTGLLFKPRHVPDLADNLARLLADPTERARLGSAGASRQRAEFTVERQTAGILAVYDDLVASA